MIVKNAHIITHDEKNTFFPNAAVVIDDKGDISEILINGDLSGYETSHEVIDAQGQYLMPASICAHTHFYGAFARGMYIPGEAPDAFPAILEKLWWRLDKSLDEQANYYSALVCIIDAIKHGTTTLVDHHASPNSIPGSLDILAKAVLESGIRASLCYEVTDRDGEERARMGLEENVRFIHRTKNEGNFNGFLSATFGLHASLTLSDETLVQARKICPEDTGFHIHAAEHVVDEYDSVSKSGKRVVERLNDLGILGPRSVVGHGVHIDANEIFILKETGTWITHQPRSNMNNAVGLPNVESMMNAGVRVCMGNDGFSNSMWQEWSAAYLGHKIINLDPRRMPANMIYEMAVVNNRDLVETLFCGLETGIIKTGAKADLILLDYKPYTEMNADNFPWHVVFGFRESAITTTIVNGKVLMKDRKILCLDEEAVHKEALEISKSVWKNYHKQFA